MKPCAYDGSRVLHVDGGLLAHAGTVIGQSDDGKQVYVMADGEHTKHGWDFSVDAAMLPTLIANAKQH